MSIYLTTAAASLRDRANVAPYDVLDSLVREAALLGFSESDVEGFLLAVTEGSYPALTESAPEAPSTITLTVTVPGTEAEREAAAVILEALIPGAHVDEGDAPEALDFSEFPGLTEDEWAAYFPSFEDEDEVTEGGLPVTEPSEDEAPEPGRSSRLSRIWRL